MSKQQLELKAIQEAIAKDDAGWEAGITPVSELTPAEKEKMLGYIPGPDDPSLEEMVAQGKAALQAYQSMAFAASSAAPASLDWRNNNGNFVTPVKNQGSCGSCVAFGTIASVEAQVKIQRGAGYAVDLSEAQLFYCHARSEGRNCGNGWWPDKAMKAFQDKGVTREQSYPYTAGDQNCSGLASDYANYLTKIAGYSKISGIQAIKEYIATKGPVEACFTVYQDFYNYQSGIYKHTTGSVVGGHCVCIVGYNSAQSYWICKNSWGTGFGESGYFRIKFGDCGIEGQVYGPTAIINNDQLNGVKITGLWANGENRNAWAYVSGYGWRKITTKSDQAFLTMLTQLASAKVTGTNCNLTISNGQISKLYVF